MKKSDLIIFLKAEIKHSERQVRQSIRTLKGILNRIEQDIQEGRPRADNGLQGNEWRLYKELSNLEMKIEFLKKLESTDE